VTGKGSDATRSIMNKDEANSEKPRFNWLECSFIFLFIILSFRFTVIAASAIWLFSHLLPNRHRSRRVTDYSLALVVVALYLPMDIHIPGISGPIFQSTHSGPRFVAVGYGFPNLREGHEMAEGGCAPPLFTDRWRLVLLE
jgi:hypothetical protein